MFPTEQLEEVIYYLPEQKPLNINFEANGIESTIFISNVGSLIWIIFIYIIIAVLSFVLRNVKCIWTRLGSLILWNGMITLFMESYQDVLLVSVLNIYQADWETPYTSEKYSNILSVIFVVLLSCLTVFFLVFLCYNRK